MANIERESIREGSADGPFHVIRTGEKWRVVGWGFSIPCRDEQKARMTLEKVREIWGNQ